MSPMTKAPPRCLDCGLPYEVMGVDLVLPDQQWKVICPEAGGILCANCLCKRAQGFSASAILGWIDNLDYSKANGEKP